MQKTSFFIKDILHNSRSLAIQNGADKNKSSSDLDATRHGETTSNDLAKEHKNADSTSSCFPTRITYEKIQDYQMRITEPFYPQTATKTKLLSRKLCSNFFENNLTHSRSKGIQCSRTHIETSPFRTLPQMVTSGGQLRPHVPWMPVPLRYVRHDIMHSVNPNLQYGTYKTTQGALNNAIPYRMYDLPFPVCTGGTLPSSSGYVPAPRTRRSRTVFSEIQLLGLERRFEGQKYLSNPDRACLAKALGLSQIQVKTWYQNRRMKWKKQMVQTGIREPEFRPKGRPKKTDLHRREQAPQPSTPDLEQNPTPSDDQSQQYHDLGEYPGPSDEDSQPLCDEISVVD